MIPIDLFGPGAEFDHIGMAMTSIGEALPEAACITDPIQKVRVAFFELHGVRIEAIEPTADDSPVSNQLGKGVKLLHLCYQVPDLDAAMHIARGKGLLPISAPVPAAGHGNRRIVWLMSRTMGLFELVEASES